MSKYDIYICYHRNVSLEFAKHLYDRLTRERYKVYLDVFEAKVGCAIERQIDECTDFIAILSENIADRGKKELKELNYAMKKGKHIIIVLDGIKDYAKWKHSLPKDILEYVSDHVCVRYDQKYFNIFFANLKRSVSAKTK